MTREDLVELLVEHRHTLGGCQCGLAFSKPHAWAIHVADEIAAKDWCVVVRGPVADT